MRNVVLFTVVLMLLASCVSREKLIARSWKFSGMELENNTDSTALSFANTISEQWKANLNIELGADSSYTILQLKEGTAVHGRWWLSADKKVLFTKTDLGLNQYNVLLLTKNKLDYEMKDPVSGQLFKVSCIAIVHRGSK